MKYQNSDKYKEKVKEATQLDVRQLAGVPLLCVLFPHVTREGEIEFTLVVALLISVMVFLPMYSSYFFRTRSHKAAYIVSAVLSGLLGHFVYLGLFSSYWLNIIAGISSLGSLVVIIHSLKTSGKEFREWG